MKRLTVFSVVAALVATVLPLAAQAEKLDAKSLQALSEKPVTQAPKFIPKSASTGPVVEKSRTYQFASKGAVSKAARVITMSDGTKTECPLVDVPLFFEKNSDRLTDPQSLANLTALANHLKGLAAGAKFCIEGHASVEGDDGKNLELSQRRATAIRSYLIARGVDQAVLAPPVGRGSADAKTQDKNASEVLLAQDRRVLIVREQ